MIEIAWEQGERKGIRWCSFEYLHVRHRMKAAACVTKLWKTEKDADAWAQANAQAICDRLDYAASAAGLKAAAETEYRQLKDDIDGATDERADLKEQYPDITDSASEVAHG